MADGSKLKLVINYNLLAISEECIDQTFTNMYQTFMNNLSPNVTLVLVSTTPTDELREYSLAQVAEYRLRIYDRLIAEGELFLEGRFKAVDSHRLHHFWFDLCDHFGLTYVQEKLAELCSRHSYEFICVHRVSNVLKKCGQYQDLILLSEGEDQAYTYTEKCLYGKFCRHHGEPLFQNTPDSRRLDGRHFDYTLVLDSDTVVPRGTALQLLAAAAGNPRLAVIQPNIKLELPKEATFFMYLERVRNELTTAENNAITNFLGQTLFCGKALINNQLYVDKIIGSPVNQLEMIPVDVMSHDTYESLILHPFPLTSVSLKEQPTTNLITWSHRQQRWTTGEVINATYIWNLTFGMLIRLLRIVFWCNCCEPFRRVRNYPPCNLTGLYLVAKIHFSLFIKPFLITYILLHSFLYGVKFRYPYIPLGGALVVWLFLPRLFVFRRNLLKYLPLELLTSILQQTSDIFVGTYRLLVGIVAALSRHPLKWLPQRIIEQKYEVKSNCGIFLDSLRVFGIYALVASIACFTLVLVDLYGIYSSYLLIYVMLGIISLLPIYCFLTGLSPMCGRRKVFKLHLSPPCNHALELSSVKRIYSIDTLVRRRMEDSDLSEQNFDLFHAVQPSVDDHSNCSICHMSYANEILPSVEDGLGHFSGNGHVNSGFESNFTLYEQPWHIDGQFPGIHTRHFDSENNELTHRISVDTISLSEFRPIKESLQSSTSSSSLCSSSLSSSQTESDFLPNGVIGAHFS
ncbi:uncharacterized protein LOC141905500 [Tubulanus polymorphus]|uniref:uncharacterized protein LOC141905500 n=1 Tax=Tubulanus polymorphus TaxID=672921 RepID=UPI003DA2F658